MSKYIKVTVKQVAASKDSATYECTVARQNSSYFGYCNKNTHLVIWKAGAKGTGKAYKHWGFPKRADWKSSWGEPSWNLWGGNKVDIGYGNLDGFLDTSYKWQEIVNIDRGNKRQGSKQIKVGVKAGPGTSDSFAKDILKTITLKTIQVPDPTLDLFVATIDTSGTVPCIDVKWSFVNPEDYYRVELYKNGEKVELKDPVHYVEKITPDMFNQTIKFEGKVYGKDNTYYKEFSKSASLTIQPIGPGVTVNNSGTIANVNAMYLNNVTHKGITEVWIKKDGKVYKTVK